ncbi:MAG: hypothetical protein M0Z68_08915 [Gammaproteobacteria bacterium]|nr:hypothetical protein [Gammaproteobacteria bacterium]
MTDGLRADGMLGVLGLQGGMGLVARFPHAGDMYDLAGFVCTGLGMR